MTIRLIVYEQILINALEMITRKAHYEPAMDDPLGQLPFTTDRCVDIAEKALTNYKNMINKEKEKTHGK